jgi:hypothetical protein
MKFFSQLLRNGYEAHVAALAGGLERNPHINRRHHSNNRERSAHNEEPYRRCEARLRQG